MATTLIDDLKRRPKVKREYILGVLFFGGLWGLSEAVLGDALYAAGVPHASVPLTVVALAVLTLARSYFPQRGTGTLIAACAMLYKFLNSPFFGCHLLGILLTGVCYDLVFDVLKVRLKSLGAAAATYLSYAAFAVMITYVFRYGHWVQGGLAKVLGHVVIGGSMAALASACTVPLIARLGERLKSRSPMPFGLLRYPIPAGVSALTLGLWAFAAVMCAWSHPFVR
ncbi:MAG: hypothetical protein A2Y76_04340 [Planctomycetes bacterium RBG_13_60_9]|nr:MAG: hypothetical protein A2Y76_04340 [Planctomycetes bacterium RBG_13_60_9]